MSKRACMLTLRWGCNPKIGPVSVSVSYAGEHRDGRTRDSQPVLWNPRETIRPDGHALWIGTCHLPWQLHDPLIPQSSPDENRNVHRDVVPLVTTISVGRHRYSDSDGARLHTHCLVLGFVQAGDGSDRTLVVFSGDSRSVHIIQVSRTPQCVAPERQCFGLLLY